MNLDLQRMAIPTGAAMKGERSDVSDTEPLLSAGLLDSMDVLQTVLFLEENFGLDFSVHPFNPDDFDSIESINRMANL